MVKAIGPLTTEKGSESETRIADIQTILIAQAADQLAAPLMMKKDVYIISPIVLDAYGLTVDSSGILKKKNDALGCRKVAVRNIHEANSEPSDNADATVTVTAGEIWNVLGILASYVCSATVATRDCTLRWAITPKQAVANSLITHALTTIQPTASQDATFYLSAQGDGGYIKNVNGTKAIVASENLLPMVMPAGSTITAIIYGSKQTGDRTGLRVFYEERN